MPLTRTPASPADNRESPLNGRKLSWWLLAGMLGAITILLFVPWSFGTAGPSVDVRPELVWESIVTVIVGAGALAIPNRWTAYLAALPTVGAATSIGRVFLPDSGSYPWPVKVVVVLLAVTGITWVITALRFPAREQSTRWIVAPVAAILTIATLWLPWVIVSGIGVDSGQMAAIELLFNANATGAPGVVYVRLAILVIMTVGIIGAVLPLLTRRARITQISFYLALGAAVALLVLALRLASRGDAVQIADLATGINAAIAGFLLIALLWNSRLRASGRKTHLDETGVIPVLMPESHHHEAHRMAVSRPAAYQASS